MTREEAIRWLEDIHRRFNPTGENLENEGGDVHLQALDMAIEALSAEAVHKPDYSYEADMVRRLKEALSAEAVEVVRCKDCKHHHTGEMYEYCDLIAVKGRRQRTVEYCSLGERKGGDSK